MATATSTTVAPSRRRRADALSILPLQGSDVRRRVHSLPAPGLGLLAARLSSAPRWTLGRAVAASLNLSAGHAREARHQAGSVKAWNLAEAGRYLATARAIRLGMARPPQAAAQ